MAHLVNAANQGWYFGVRVQHTLGPKTLANIGFPVTPSPPGNSPTISITAPVEGAVLASSSVVVSGPITGTPQLYVTVNALSAPLTGGGTGFTRTLTLADGLHTIVAKVGNSYGHQRDDVAITVDTTPPVVSITAPASGTLTTANSILVTGTATDATSGVASVVVNGVTATLSGSTFSAEVPLAIGENSITATATDVAGNGSPPAATSVTRGVAPTISITTPGAGFTTGQAEVLVTGSVGGTEPVTVLVNQVPATVSAGTYSATVPLSVGPNTIRASAENGFGSIFVEVAGDRTASGVPLAISIQSPPNGAVTSARFIPVSGSVSDGTANVTVNGTAAIVAGEQYVAPVVELAEGENTLTANAMRGAESVDAQVTVTYDPPPRVVITAPSDGSTHRTFSVDVEGVVDDLASYVDVNGVRASVASGGRFFASGVPLALGENPLVARAIDLRGGIGTDQVAVTRDDAAAPPLRIAFVTLARFPFFVDAETQPTAIVAHNAAEFREALAPLGFPPDDFAPAIAHIEARVGDHVAFVFAETPAALDFYENGNLAEASIPVAPIETLAQDFWFVSGGLDAALISTLLPTDIDARYYTTLDLSITSDPSGPQGVTEIEVTGANGATTSLTVEGETDIPIIAITTPVDGSVVSGNAITVTGTASESGRLFQRVRYEVLDETFAVVAQGSAPLVGGRFTVPEISLASGPHCVLVTAFDAAGNNEGAITCVTVDATAPIVQLVSPREGEGVLADRVSVDLNFAVAATLVSVDGTPDGRAFPTGLASDVMSLPLAPGANVVTLVVDAGSGPVPFSFTVFRITTVEPIAIVDPIDGDVRNTTTALVTVRAPIGTRTVTVNGASATRDVDGVSYVAEIPIATGENLVTAIAYPFGQTAEARIVGDFKAPRFLGGIPEDGDSTPEPDIFLLGFYDEAAEITIETEAGDVSTSTRFDPARTSQLFGFEVYRFEIASLALAPGSNAIAVRARDAAGNESLHNLAIDRQGVSLLLASPPDGSAFPSLRATVGLEALADLTIEAWYAGSTRLPAFDGAVLSPGISTFTDVPLEPGENDLRIVYRRSDGTQETLRFGLESTAASYGTVQGTVTSASTGTGLSAARVTITVNGLSVAVTTGADGTYVARVEPGSASIRVAREGFLDETLAATVVAGDTRVADAAVLPWSTSGQPVPGAPPGTTTSTIAGVVRDAATSDPIVGALVQVLAGATPISVTTGTDGSYTLTGIPSGEFAMIVSRSGYSTRTFAVPFDAAVILALDVPLETGATGGDPTTTVAGTVTDSDGTPLAGADVIVDVGGLIASATTGADGRYLLEGISPGAFSVVISLAGYFPQLYEVPFTTAVLVPLNPVLVRLATTITLTGTVRSGITGAPEAGVDVELLGLGVEAQTDASGRFTIAGAPIGSEQTLRLAKPGFLEEFESFTLSALPEGYPVDLELTYPIFESSAATLAIGPNASGTVVDALTGKPIAGALIQAGSLSAVANAEGEFTLHDLPLRSPVELIATAADFEPQVIVALVVAGGADPIEFTLGAQRLGEVQGVVTDAVTGLPVAEAEVSVVGSETLVAATKPDGSYRLLSVPVGTHDLSIASPEHFVSTVDDLSVAETVPATFDASLTPRPRTGGLAGRVLDHASGDPIGGALLTATGGLSTTTATDGSYAFASLPAGLARLTISAAGYPTSLRAAPVLADVDSENPTVTTQDFRIGAGAADASAMSAVIVASDGGHVETPDGRARLDIPPGSLTGDGEITIRISPDPDADSGDALTMDPDLEAPEITALSDQIEILVAAPPGGTKPYLVGPVFLSARFYEDASLAANAAEQSAFPYLFDGTGWTALEMVPYLHAVDRVNNLVVVGLIFGETLTGRDVVAQRTTLRPIQLAQAGGGGLPLEDLVLDAYRLVVGAVDAVIPDGRVAVIDLLRDDFFNPRGAGPPFFPINTYSRPVLVAHGWSPWSILFNSTRYTATTLREDERYSTMLSDLIGSTNAIYRPIFLTYNSRESLGANAQAFAELIQALYPDGTEESPLFPDAFKQEENGDPNAYQNPKGFGTFDSFGFSMGGLLNRAYQRASFYFDSAPELPGDEARRGRINRMVSLGTPHHGALQVLRAFGAALGAVTRFPSELILRAWSPGTAQLLDYVDSPTVPCSISGNSFMCQMNRDMRSGPTKEISLIAGTKSVVGWGPVLFEAGLFVVPTAVSDGVVPLSSAHGESTLSRRLVPALQKRETFREPFDHFNAGTDATGSGEGNQRISAYVDEDILPTLQDHWVVRRRALEEEGIPAVVGCPTVEEDAVIDVNIAFDFKAITGGLTGIGIVAYAEDPDGEWHIVHGADPSTGALDSQSVLTAEGNSRAVLDPDEELVLEFRRPIEAGVDAQRMLLLVVTTGGLSPTEGKAPTELSEAFIEYMDDAGRITSCSD